MANAQPHQVVTGKLLTGQSAACLFVQLPAPRQVLVRDPFLTEMTVGLFVRQHVPDQFKALNAKLRGYYNYFGVYSNLSSLNTFYLYAVRALWKYLNRRSQRKSYNWVGFNQLMEQFNIAKPRIVGRPKRAVMRVASGLA